MSNKKHVYALFDDRAAATEAFADLQKRCGDGHCSLLVHERYVDDEDLPMGETAAREGAVRGAAILGAAGAVIAGLVAVGGGILGAGPLAAALFGAGAGGIYGGVFGAISGSDEPDEALRHLAGALETGKILITVEADEASREEMASQVLEAHGGAVTA